VTVACRKGAAPEIGVDRAVDALGPEEQVDAVGAHVRLEDEPGPGQRPVHGPGTGEVGVDVVLGVDHHRRRSVRRLSLAVSLCRGRIVPILCAVLPRLPFDVVQEWDRAGT
jgi:hypothetical protein